MGMKEAASGARRNDTVWRLRGAASAAITIQSVGRGQRSRPGAGN